jgi:hypothetical protein
VYELASAGLTDREVGGATGLALKHVAEILTNPFYVGRLWSGEPSALGALVDQSTWEHVQALRARYSRRHRGAVTRRQCGLAGLLVCAACGRHLIGHVGRYRHVDACEQFRAAAPRRIQADGETFDPRVRGESYKVEVYEDAIGRAFGHVAVSARLKIETVPETTRPKPDDADAAVLARISRERDQAALRFARDRDLCRLEATMARLRGPRISQRVEAQVDDGASRRTFRLARLMHPELASSLSNLPNYPVRINTLLEPARDVDVGRCPRRTELASHQHAPLDGNPVDEASGISSEPLKRGQEDEAGFFVPVARHRVGVPRAARALVVSRNVSARPYLSHMSAIETRMRQPCGRDSVPPLTWA